MLILKIIILLHVIVTNKMFIINKIFIINEIGNIKDNNKLMKKFIKPKTRKLFKSQNLAKSRKKLSKNRNLPNFNAIKTRLSFLSFNIKTVFKCLKLIFIKALIL